MDWSPVLFASRSSTTSSSIAELDLPQIKLESESELSDLTESVDSAQMELTGRIRKILGASCEDTPDTESSSLASEFSVPSTVSSAVSIPEISSGPEDSHVSEPFFTSKSSQSGVGTQALNNKCIKCHRNNRNFSLLFCDRCNKERKRYRPPPPMRKRKKTAEKSMLGAIKGEVSKSSAPQTDMGSALLPLCGCCFERPSDGIFIHGDIGHQIFCYSCCQRVWLERKLCPYCNRLISKVVKLFTVEQP